ncbi:MAG: hypothetical protein V3T70_11210, partial [Phycisphaerae bacterium]
GHYLPAHMWCDRNRTDMTVAPAHLHEGWNRIEVHVEGLFAPRDDGWGFSVRLTDWDNAPLDGLAFRVTEPDANEQAPVQPPPEIGKQYDWNTVRIDFHHVLPRLTAADLSRLTGIDGIELRGGVYGDSGHLVIVHPSASVGPTYRAPPNAWDAERHEDWRLNNVLDWSREDVAALAYRKDGSTRTLLFVRLEAIKPYLELLRESPAAGAAFDGRPPSQRVLGYLTVPPLPGGSMRTLIVVDAMLGEPEAWPADEEDLLRLPLPPPAQPANPSPAPNQNEIGPPAPAVPASAPANDGPGR